jgi:hypothetical protein
MRAALLKIRLIKLAGWSWMRGEMRRSRSGILREGQYQRRVAVSQERAAIVIFCCKQMEDGSGAMIGMTVVGRRAGVIADTMTCIVVKKYASTEVQEYNGVMRWIG